MPYNQDFFSQDYINKLVKHGHEEMRKNKKMGEFLKTGFTNVCARCGDVGRAKADGNRNDLQGYYCTDVWACEWDVWSLPCCQYCHEQFNPRTHPKCAKAPVDPFGNQPHISGGKFWTHDQKEDIKVAEEAEPLPDIIPSIKEMIPKLEKQIKDELLKKERSELERQILELRKSKEKFLEKYDENRRRMIYEPETGKMYTYNEYKDIHGT